jgi:Ni,Fe-hydrogenase I large subunit
MAANYLMSHILHFYHLVALDYVDVNGTGLIPKGFLCPNYDSDFYARGIDPVLQTGGLGAPAYTVNALHNPGTIPAAALGDLTPYFAGQYVRALKFRRMAQQLGALFTGKMPHASSYTPGCVTTKPYDPSLTGGDTAVVQKVHELLYGGPGFTPSAQDGSTSGRTHPINSPALVSLANPHPESLMGFIGKPTNFWSWAAGGFSPSELPLWAGAGVPGAGSAWKEYTGTYLFDAVAAAHVFPEYFWIGSGYNRFLAWGIFEGADIMGFGDNRLITRGRVHVPQNPNTSGTPYSYLHLGADHRNVKEFISNAWYTDATNNKGRHMWKGKTAATSVASKPSAYTFAKAPRYHNMDASNPADHPADTYLPYEVGPLSRGMSNASGLTTPGGPATAGEVGIGVFPGWAGNPSASGSTNLTAHLTWALGAGVFYLPPKAVSGAALANAFYADYQGDATLDRIAARALETYFVGSQMLSWFNGINPLNPSNLTKTFSWGGKDRPQPKSGKGAGLTEAPRGALGHWIVIGKGKRYKANQGKTKWRRWRGKNANYQIITPTTWNINPKDANDVTEKTLGLEGPIERCLLNTPLVDEKEPLEILRVIHSFDPCCACTVHVMNPKKEKVFEATLEAIS